MKFRIATTKLQDAVSRVIKGASNNKLIPITGMMDVCLQNGELAFVTTDGTNYLKVKAHEVSGDDMQMVVPAVQFSKLVSKLTCEVTEIVFKPDVQILEIKGNGTYKMELPLDESGQLVKYPNPFIAESTAPVDEIDTNAVRVVLDVLKQSLATTMENPCYTGYYIGDSVIATDTYKIANLGEKLLSKPALVSPELMNLLSVVTDDTIEVVREANDAGFTAQDKIQFVTDDVVVYGVLMEDIDEFANEAISELVDTEYDSMCQVAKSDILQALDRLALFVGPYDKGAISVTFGDDSIGISSKADSGIEEIPYIAKKDVVPYSCELDIQMLMEEVKVVSADTVTIYFGRENAIQLVDGNVTIVLALIEE